METRAASVGHNLFAGPDQPTNVGHARIEVGEMPLDGAVRREEEERHPNDGLSGGGADGQGVRGPL